MISYDETAGYYVQPSKEGVVEGWVKNWVVKKKEENWKKQKQAKI